MSLRIEAKAHKNQALFAAEQAHKPRDEGMDGHVSDRSSQRSYLSVATV